MNKEINDVNKLKVGDFVSVFIKGSEISGDIPMLIIEKHDDSLVGLNHSGKTYLITNDNEVTLEIPSEYVEDIYFIRLKQYLDTLIELRQKA